MKKSSGISPKNNVARIIDANLNRAKEGLRVCEEITRFILDNPEFTAQLKEARHKLRRAGEKLYPAQILLKERFALADVGRLNSHGELARQDCRDIFRANIQRVKESLRVLEEFAKLKNTRAALIFKQLRYKIYEIEKESFKAVSGLSDPE